jgi:hypothetical protein
MSEHGTDFQNYLDEKFSGIMRELGHIRENTDRTNGKVAEQEKRIRDLENSQNRCPIKQVQKKVNQLETDTQNIRIYAKSAKLMAVIGFPVIVLTALGLALQLLNII